MQSPCNGSNWKEQGYTGNVDRQPLIKISIAIGFSGPVFACSPVKGNASVYQQDNQLLRGEYVMAENVYKVIELVGTSTESWEKAAAAAVQRAGQSLRDLRIAEIAQLDMQIKDGKVDTYRAKVKVSFKYEGGI